MAAGWINLKFLKSLNENPACKRRDSQVGDSATFRFYMKKGLIYSAGSSGGLRCSGTSSILIKSGFKNDQRIPIL